MTNSDFAQGNKAYTIDHMDVDKYQGLLPCFCITFLRGITECPRCNEKRITKRRISSRKIFAIVNGIPAFCIINRHEYRCNNPYCEQNHFYNTDGHEDDYFAGQKCTRHFVYYILERWLSKKQLSFGDIEKRYGISATTVKSWSSALRAEFQAHVNKTFTITRPSVMVFRTFNDRHGEVRGFVGLNSNEGFKLFTFLDDYSDNTLKAFYSRIENSNYLVKVYYDGAETIGASLTKVFTVPVERMDINEISNALCQSNTLLKKIVSQIHSFDSYESIVIKYLYDTKTFKEEILHSLRKTAWKRGLKFKGIGPDLSYFFPFNLFFKDKVHWVDPVCRHVPEYIENMTELPTINDQ